jgi:DNA-binding CsgD family transcriptional regulator
MKNQQLIDNTLKEAKPILNKMPGAVMVHDIQDQSLVYMNDWGIAYLQTTWEFLQATGLEYYKLFFNEADSKEYVPRLYSMLQKNDKDEIITFFQQVKSYGSQVWNWHFSSSRIFLRDPNQAPLLIITNSIPVDPELHITRKVQRLLDENNFLNENGNLLLSLTKREKEVLLLMAQDISASEISQRLNLSQDTIKTHRRNIKKKIGAVNYYDIVRFAQAFNLI